MKPATLNILYEDDSIIVCVKPHGIATQSKNVSTPDMETMLLNHLAKTDKNPYLAIIHRLDQPVSGILVFAKTPVAAKELNKQLQTGDFGKCYLAEVSALPPNPSGTLTDYLIKDGRSNTSKICDKSTTGAKLAKLNYRIMEKTPPILEIHLDTGRHHQIRVQLAHLGCPIVGDTKYNPAARNQKGWQELKLCAYKLSFSHPITHKTMTFQMPNT